MDAPTGSIAPKPRPTAAKSKPTPATVKSSAVTNQGASAASPTRARLSTKFKTTADVGPSASNARPGAARAKPSTPGATKPSTTGAKHHAANVNPSAARPKPSSTVKPPQAGVAGSKPNAAAVQTVSAQLDVVHQKAIQSIDAANKAMSMARADLEKARASKEDRNKVVSRANEVAAALLAPSRQVVQLLAGHGVLFPPCKQLSKSLSVLSKLEAGRHGSDVRVAVVHLDLARALVQFGALSRKSRPAKSLADPLGEVSKRFNGVIEEFGKFCEAYYETKATGSRFKHLLRWNSNKDSLYGFADRIAGLKRDLGGLLSQQATQQPWKHANALAQIESHLGSNRAFYGTIHDADEEVAQALSSKHGGETDVQIDGSLLKQLAGAVGDGIGQGLANAFKGTKAKQPQKAARPTFGSKLQNTVNKFVPGSQQKAQTHPKPASHEPAHSPGGKAIDHNNPVSAGDELHEEQYIWEVGNELELGDYFEDQEDNLQEDGDSDGERGGVGDEDQDAYVQEGDEVGIRLDGEDDGDQQGALQENEEAEGEQGESGDEQEVHPQEDEDSEGGLEGECNDHQEHHVQEGGDDGSEPGGDNDSGQGPYVDEQADEDEDQGPYAGNVDDERADEDGDQGSYDVDGEQADEDVDQGPVYYPQDDGDDSDGY